MFDFLTSLANWFHSNKQSVMNDFIESKNPKNAGDVEYWMREFERKNQFMSF